MLDLMRKHAKSWLIKIALGGVIVVFIFWYGWSGPSSEQSRSYVAKVNDKVISHNEFDTAYQSKLEEIRLRFKGAIPPDLFEKLNLKKEVAQNLINRVLLNQEAARLGLVVTNEDLVQDIRSNPMFQQNGMFDESQYRQILSTIKLNPAMYEQTRRQELLENQVVSLFTDAVKTDPEEIKRFWHFQHDQLVLSVLLVKPEEETAVTAPDQKTLENFFKENQEKYRIPASLNLQYVVFSWRDVQKKLSVSKEEAREYYQRNPKEFTEPEKARAKHILVKLDPDADQERTDQARKKAQEIVSRLNKGEDFDTVAREVSDDEATKEKGGDLGWIAKGSLSPELERVAAQLEVGKVSEQVRTPQGYDILMVTQKEPERTVEFESVEDKITQKLLEEKARKQVTVDSDNYYELAYRTEDLAEPANKFGFELRQAEGVTKAGGIPEVGNDPKVLDEAFSLRTGEVSRLLKSGDNFILMKLVEKKKERDPELAEVQSIVERDYRKDRALSNVRKKAEEIIHTLRDKPDEAEEIAGKVGLKWEKLEPVSRTAGFIPQLGSSAEVLEMLTSVSSGAPIFARPVSVPAGVAVVRLLSVERASDEQYAKESEDFEKWVKEVRKTDFLRGWLRVLEEKSKIDLNEKIL